MDWNQEDVRLAFRIFLQLLPTGRVQDDQELLYHYEQNPNVRFILEEIIEKEADLKIFAMGTNLYLTPGINNDFFGYTNEELRAAMKLENNSELYLAYFAMLCLLAQFYNSDDQALTSRQFLPLEELEAIMTGHIAEIETASEEQVTALEETMQVNLSSVARIWSELPAFNETLKYQRRGRNNRISFLLRVLSFLENEGLVQVLGDSEIRLLPKLEHLVIKYYFHSQRKDQLLQLLAQPLDFGREEQGREDFHAQN
ncbi:MAG: hypothetical protein GX249_01740 [Firmicutes bacterium]|nr:hypothetical protein [Bacillota bacterium]